MTTMNLSLREARMVLERLVLVAGVDAGLVPSIRECALFSAVSGPAGFEAVEANMDALRGADPGKVKILEEGGTTAIDGQGLHAWFGVFPLVDLLSEQMQDGHSAMVRVTGFIAPEELQAAVPIGRRQGLAVSADLDDHGVWRAQRTTGGQDPIMDIIRNGIPVNDSLWWRLFDESDKALAPDSFESRRHAGALIVEADGRVIGRQDEDDTDLSMLTAASSASAGADIGKVGRS